MALRAPGPARPTERRVPRPVRQNRGSRRRTRTDQVLHRRTRPARGLADPARSRDREWPRIPVRQGPVLPTRSGNAAHRSPRAAVPRAASRPPWVSTPRTAERQPPSESELRGVEGRPRSTRRAAERRPPSGSDGRRAGRRPTRVPPGSVERSRAGVGDRGQDRGASSPASCVLFVTERACLGHSLPFARDSSRPDKQATRCGVPATTDSPTTRGTATSVRIRRRGGAAGVSRTSRRSDPCRGVRCRPGRPPGTRGTCRTA